MINNYINKYILCCFPNKEYVLKNEIDSCMYSNIKYIFMYQIYSNRLDILYDILVNVSMLDYYVYICFNKGIIKNKRYVSVSNYLLDCYYDIKRNTKNRDKLVKYDMFISSNIINLYNKLISGKYKHSFYNIFLIYEPKVRIIMSECINDKIVSHLICKYYLIDIIDKKLINSNIATRNGMGSSYGIKLLKKYINSIKLKHNKFYILKIDIKKYFFNIDHNILLGKLYNIVDSDIYSIIKNIIDSTNKVYVNDRISKLIDNKDYLYKYNKGLNIGSYISQILASFYLNDIDHYIKEKLRIKYYIRYVDDFILIDYNYGYLVYCLYNKLIIKVKYKNKVKIRRKLKYLKMYDIDKYNIVVNSYKEYFL